MPAMPVRALSKVAAVTVVAGAAAGLAFWSGPALAFNPENPGIVSFQPGVFAQFNPCPVAFCTVGYSFTLADSYDVSYLGVWDLDEDGLVNSHEVGIWDNGGNLLVSAAVDVLTATLVNEFQWVKITSYRLAPGDYSIAAQYVTLDDLFALGVANIVTDPRVTYNEGLVGLSDVDFADATPFFDIGNQPGYIGPNFAEDIGIPPVPGPLPALGAAAAFGYSRKLRKRIARSKAVPVASAID